MATVVTTELSVRDTTPAALSSSASLCSDGTGGGEWCCRGGVPGDSAGVR